MLCPPLGRVAAATAWPLAFACAAAWLGAAPPGRALGPTSQVDLRGVSVGDAPEPRPTARQRLAWEVRKRTSVQTRLEPTATRFDDPSIFATPFLYWSGDRAFRPLRPAELSGLRRFIELGGFLLIDDAGSDAFDASIRRALARAFPSRPLRPLPSDHVIYHSFYLIDRPVGRVLGPDHMEAITRAGRVAVLYTRQDLGGAWARDNLGTWTYSVVPGGSGQREMAIRLGVNIVMYALCLDYKDDQVHAPFIMRRLGARP